MRSSQCGLVVETRAFGMSIGRCLNWSVKTRWWHVLLFAIGTTIGCALHLGPTVAANEPCGGKKGGINHCQGSTFICNDGSVSGSKKNCQSYMGGVSLMGSAAAEMTPTTSGSCTCNSGTYCTGPRAGISASRTTGRRAISGNDGQYLECHWTG